MLKYLLLLSCLLQGPQLFAWSAVGHRIVGRIAYDALTPKAKHQFAHLNQFLNDEHHHFNLIDATVWLDLLYEQHLMSYRSMHYIDIPFSMDNTPLPKIPSNNAVSAIRQSSLTLNDPNATTRDKAIALRILLHVVGDIHQPLHTTTRVTADYPSGDQGGNLFPLGKNKVASNLHRYWDQGGGLLIPHMSARDRRQLATEIKQQWACPPEDLNAMHWAEEAHTIAVNQVYTLNEHAIPSSTYEAKTQTITKQQLAYAGCRLALLLNHLAVN